jgi:hypothetical protein
VLVLPIQSDSLVLKRHTGNLSYQKRKFLSVLQLELAQGDLVHTIPHPHLSHPSFAF